jgi:hypothetical protein
VSAGGGLLGGVNRPPAAWFADPQLDGPTPLTVTEEGRVYGHAAAFGVCHIADPYGDGSCVLAPRSSSGYAYFHLGALETAEGDDLSVGQITLGTGHAGRRADRAAAAAHYDDTGTTVADVRAGEDEFGIWIAGALRPGVNEERRRELAAAKLSGDWRSVRGQLELVGLLAVNVPGFPVPRPEARVAVTAGGQQVLALTAAGVVVVDEDCGCLTAAQVSARRAALSARARGGRDGLLALARGE